ncbi:metallophosphoesterase [Cellulomonas marina]|uniref:Predicted phosphohydrolase, MPP superfamily n=1 Tax=Cellulomonas marina TaxID=988821 RepID=A0A1I0WVY7_9CELL|nr:metallophosphoesterase [Cellulomonas marina]GIG30337.1 metallophosphoesterase [Cellulomonas marina]SFA92083.1 Predicted phosphohydrolase, MPP superfamily [Cellulomonas marina]
MSGPVDPLLRGALALGALGAGALGWATLVERDLYALREVAVPMLPAGQAPLRVLHLADLHLLPGQRRKVDWVRDLASLDPHLVVDTGDNWSHTEAGPALLRALEPHLARPGAFVLGSNDYVAPVPRNPARYLRSDSRGAPAQSTPLPWRELVATLEDAGWTNLENRRGVVTLDGRRVALVGTSDAHLDADRYPPAGGPDDARTGGDTGGDTVGGTSGGTGGGTDGGTDGGTAGDVNLLLGVTHAPYRRVLDAFHADGADLVLAGHTHGGQLCVPGYGALVTNCDLDRRRAKGLHGWPGPRPDRPGGHRSTWLHVSAGLGTSPYAPARFACRPEATLLTLLPA